MALSAEGFKLVVEGSSTMMTWALAIGAGSVAAIVSTSYLRPRQRWARIFYLLFPVGWIFLGISVYFGSEISGQGIASVLVSTTAIHESIFKEMNTTFLSQQRHLAIGLSAFAVWLLLYLGWWIYVDKVAAEKS